MSEERELEGVEPPLKQCCLCCEGKEDPGFFILFGHQADIHRIVPNAQRNHPTNTRAPLIPLQQPTTGQSYAAFCQFLDDVALTAGMTNNFTYNATNNRQPGLYDGVQHYHADTFELLLNTYVWGLGVGNTMGSLYRVSPSGAGRATFTQKSLGGPSCERTEEQRMSTRFTSYVHVQNENLAELYAGINFYYRNK